ncbi:MAG: hypothetical protein ABII18_07320 [bacterium]|nr:DUF1285 domain-containing protein [bacterium]MBU1917944.1 DUF1285 domain-containing protein [bacterium]
MTKTANYNKGTIRLSSEGIWYHEDVEITHKRTVALFNKSISVDEKGGYYLNCDKKPVSIVVDDVAFFVTGLTKNGNNYQIKLSDGTQEPLDVKTIDIGDANQLYCSIKDSNVKALFERKVYYELMKGLAVRDGYYGLVVEDLFYPLQSVEGVSVYKSQEVKKKPAKKTLRQAQGKKVVKKKVVKKTEKKKVAKKPVKKKAVKKIVAKKVTKKKVAKKAAKKSKVKEILKRSIKKKVTAKKTRKK